MFEQFILRHLRFPKKKNLIGPASTRSYKISVVCNRLVGQLVGNTVFSETALRIFLIFCLKLRDHKGRNITEPDF